MYPSMFDLINISVDMLIVVYVENRYIKFHLSLLGMQNMFWLFVIQHNPIARL
jgi:hypothetical protein